MALYAGNLGAISVRLATLNRINAGKDGSGLASDLTISASANVNVSAGTTYFTGDLQTKTGTISSSSDASNLTLSTAAGNLILDPYSKISASKELTTTQGDISSTGTALTLSSGTGDITLTAASSTVKTAGSYVSSRSGINFTTNGVANTISSGTGNIQLQPASGGKVTTNAELRTTHGSITSQVGATVSTDADDLTLSPFRDLIATVPFKTTNGNISSTAAATGGLTISTAAGNVAINPASGSNLTTDAPFHTSNGSIVSSVAATISTNVGDLTLAPFGNVILDKDTVLTTGNLSTPSGTQLNLTPGNGTVYIDGDLQVTGTITTVNATSLEVEDKTITLAHQANPTNTTADGSGMVIEGDAYAASEGSKDLSLIWHNNPGAGNSPYWRLSGGDFYITRDIDGTVVTYQFVIDSTTQNLVLRKQVDSASASPVAEFGVVA